MIEVRYVRITFANGTTVTGVLPASVSDAELASIKSHGVDVVFSDAYAAPGEAPLGRVLALGQNAEERLLA